MGPATFEIGPSANGRAMKLALTWRSLRLERSGGRQAVLQSSPGTTHFCQSGPRIGRPRQESGERARTLKRVVAMRVLATRQSMCHGTAIAEVLRVLDGCAAWGCVTFLFRARVTSPRNRVGQEQ